MSGVRGFESRIFFLENSGLLACAHLTQLCQMWLTRELFLVRLGGGAEVDEHTRVDQLGNLLSGFEVERGAWEGEQALGRRPQRLRGSLVSNPPVVVVIA